GPPRGGIWWRALVDPPRRAGKHHHHCAAAKMPRAQSGRKCLAVHARQLAFEPDLQIIRRSRRPLLRGLEQARRSAVAHHVYRIASMGARVLINGTRYKFGNQLRGYTGQLQGEFMHRARRNIVSCFATARKFGIWAPNDRIFSVPPPGVAMDLIADYLMDVGTMLIDGHFSEAKQHAKSRKAAFASAYAK